MDQIAAAAGVSKGLLYHYFPGKKELYVAAVSRAAGDLLAATDRPGLPPHEQLVQGLTAYLDYVQHNAASWWSLMRGAAGDEPAVRAVVASTRAAFVDRIVAGATSAPSPLMLAAVRGWVAMVEAVAAELVEGTGLSPEAARDLLVAGFGPVRAVLSP